MDNSTIQITNKTPFKYLTILKLQWQLMPL